MSWPFNITPIEDSMNSLRVGTYNILIPRPDVKEITHSWDSRKEQIVDTITRGFDLVGLQEVDTSPTFNQAQYVLEELQKRKWDGYIPGVTHPTKYDKEDIFHSRVPIFWNTNLLQPLFLNTVQVSNAYPAEEKETPIVENRYASYGLFQTSTGEHLFFITHHLQHGFDHGLAEQIMASRKQANALTRIGALTETMKEFPVVVAGDFNNPTPWSLLDTSYGLQDSFDVAEEVECKKFNTFHNWQNPLLLNSEHIDHIYVNDKVKVLAAKILLDKGSDHYPVVAVIDL